MNDKQKHRYMGGLDGLRALSVLAVIAYHMNLPWAGGGFLGVGIFFVLSGYLITDLLIQEWNDTHTINLINFWTRRAKRLLPAMISVVIVVICYVLVFHRSLLQETWMDARAALFYFSNWWSIFHQQSYFDSFANPSLLKHFWSLAVEEQFYLIWPLLVLLVLRLSKSVKLLYVMTLLLAATSIIGMGLLYQSGTDPSRVYYGTDTRAFALLFGAILACIWPSQHLSAKGNKAVGIFLDSVGTLALIFLLLCLSYVNQFEEFLYSGGLALFSLVAVVLISALAHPSTLLGKWLGIKPLRWIGARSYGMYLWHYPIIQLTTPAAQANEIQPLRIAIQLTLIVVVSALSYHFIEDPIRRSAKDFGRLPIRKVTLGLCALILIFSGTSVLAQQISTSPLASEKPSHKATNHGSNENKPKSISKKKVTAASGMKGSVVSKHPTHEKNKTENKPRDKKKQQMIRAQEKKQPQKTNTPTAKQKTAQAASPITDQQVTAIGDSVMLGAEPYLKKSIVHLVIDCKLGRQFSEAFTTLNHLNQQGKLNHYVVIELGTNGPFTTEQMDELIALIGKQRKIILVNTRVPRPWEATVNKVIQKTDEAYGNVVSVDWHRASEGQRSYVGNDGVHLSVSGAEKYTELIVQAIHSLK
ncbi:acyltransferase family protein [Sporolactobacillus sp. STCC-11]|uniref:acyltransferase family protein n=1 Tax=Sporolactobacillus caesalpiniae TaxID=3230362 RepID=UPI003394F943